MVNRPLVGRSSREKPLVSGLGVLKLLSALQTISLLTLNAGLQEDIEGLCPTSLWQRDSKRFQGRV